MVSPFAAIYFYISSKGSEKSTAHLVTKGLDDFFGNSDELVHCNFFSCQNYPCILSIELYELNYSVEFERTHRLKIIKMLEYLFKELDFCVGFRVKSFEKSGRFFPYYKHAIYANLNFAKIIYKQTFFNQGDGFYDFSEISKINPKHDTRYFTNDEWSILKKD